MPLFFLTTPQPWLDCVAMSTCVIGCVGDTAQLLTGVETVHYSGAARLDARVMISSSKPASTPSSAMIPSLPAAFFSPTYRPLGIPFNTYGAMLCNWTAINSFHEAQQKVTQVETESKADSSYQGTVRNSLS